MAGPHDFIYPAPVASRRLLIPDLFVSFPGTPLIPNPNVSTVTVDVNRWSHWKFNMDEETAYIFDRGNFTLLAALWAPNADASGLHMVSEWLYWIAMISDQIEDGGSRGDAYKAAQAISASIEVFGGRRPIINPNSAEDRITSALQHIWLRFADKFRSPEMLKRFKDAHLSYFIGALAQSEARNTGRPPTVEDYMVFRRRSIAGLPAFVMIQYAQNVELPERVQNHPSIKALENASIDAAILANDILSYQKALEIPYFINLITILTSRANPRNGMSEQEALNHMTTLISKCYRDWDAALRSLPSFDAGGAIDRQVGAYVDICRNWAAGKLLCCYTTDRHHANADDREWNMVRELIIPNHILPQYN